MKFTSKAKNITLALITMVSLASCGSAKNVAGEVSDNKKAVETKVLDQNEEILVQTEDKNINFMSSEETTVEETAAKGSASILDFVNQQEAEEIAVEDENAPQTVEKIEYVQQTSNVITSYIVEYKNTRKEYANTEAGLSDAKADAFEEILAMEYISKAEKTLFIDQVNKANNLENLLVTVGDIRLLNDQHRPIEKQSTNVTAVEKKSKSDANLTLVEVKKVLDGDTVVVDLNGVETKVSLIGVTAPETVHPTKEVEFFGEEASNFTKELLEGKKIFLEIGEGAKDKYGRTLAYLWLVKPADITNPTYEELRDQTVNGILLAEGYANASTYSDNAKYAEKFVQMERDAREAGLGLWNESQRASWQANK